MTINWGEAEPLSWSKVEDSLAADPPQSGVDWDKVLWFGVPPDELARRVGAWLKEPPPELPYAARHPFAAAGQAVSDAEDAALDAAGEAGLNLWNSAAPYLGAAALVWLALQIRKAR